MYEKDLNRFREICQVNGLFIDDEKLGLLDKYTDLLVSKNQAVNLISKTSEEHIWEEHILHSLSFLFLKKIKSDAKILDLGTGGGLPGIPLKILFPDIDITLLDSTKKKISAVNEIIKALNLNNIRGISFRAEEINRNSDYQHKFDYVIARAVSSLKNIIEWTGTFLKPQNIEIGPDYIPFNSILVLKGGDIREEIKQIENNKIISYIENVELKYIDSDKMTNPDKRLVIVHLK